MPAIRTVVCPVDFGPDTARQVAFAADLCRAFGARLVLHHNLQSVPLGAGVSWMWETEHPGRLSEAGAEQRLAQLLADLPAELAREARVTHGPRAQAVLGVGEAVEADLFVLTSHGPTSEEHVSIAEILLDHSRRSLLVLHEPELDRDVPHFATADPVPQCVLVPTSLSPQSLPAVEVGFELARRLPVELHLLYLASTHADAAAVEAAGEKLSDLVPEELRARVRLHVEKGDPGEGITRAADRLSAACIVMGEHTHAPLRRWFRRDHSRAVLHSARCPVWYVPAPAA
jgi:nucleotide-binding universal stress UspA family protein